MLTKVVQFSTTEVKKLQVQIQEIDEKRKDGNFVAEDGNVPGGNAEVCDLLQRCLQWAELVLERFAFSSELSFARMKTNVPHAERGPFRTRFANDTISSWASGTISRTCP